MDFSKIIIRWYHKNKRDLPWRHTSDPYKIWLSEIILQQTRVQQGLPYYKVFIGKFPTVHDLARAKDDVVMKAWQGLGYYSRARNLHHTARYISTELKGRFPNDYETIKSLKGIGDYTAAAIASFAFNKPHAVVDGNVFRVLARCFGIHTPIDSTEGKKAFTRMAEQLLDKKDPGTFNQAIMEFGALQCVPQSPDCRKCPLKKSCKALARNEVDQLPVKSQKTKVRTRFFNYFVMRKQGKLLIRKRTEKDIWKNLYDLPLLETKKEVRPRLTSPKGRKSTARALNLGNAHIVDVSKTYKHILSHQIIFARFWVVTDITGKIENCIYIADNQLNKFAFPRLIQHFLEEKVA